MYLDASPDEVLGAVEGEQRSFAFRLGKDVRGFERVDSEPLLRLLVDLPREEDETPLHRVVETERILWGVLEALLLPERIVSVVLEARVHRNPVPHPHEVVEDLIELPSVPQSSPLRRLPGPLPQATFGLLEIPSHVLHRSLLLLQLDRHRPGDLVVLL